jgi:N-acetyl-anhydromuramyl-L-alanine amidase AmpD
MRQIRRIVVHHAAAATNFERMRRDHIDNRGWSDIGYHYVVEENGRVRFGRPPHRQGAHVSGHNADTIGVCVSVDAREPVRHRAMRALLRVVADLVRQYDLTVSDVFGHGEISATLCPCMDMDELRARIKEATE